MYPCKTLWYSIKTAITQSNQPQNHSYLQISTSTLNTQEATSESSDGSPTFSTTLPLTTTTEMIVAADSSSEFRKVNVQILNLIISD